MRRGNTAGYSLSDKSCDNDQHREETLKPHSIWAVIKVLNDENG